jgi:hypothetical protein
MSWSVSTSGKPRDCINIVRHTLTGYKCAEPEEAIKGKALELIKDILEVQPEGVTVVVSAYGSQSTRSDDPQGKALNTMTISVQSTRVAVAPTEP